MFSSEESSDDEEENVNLEDILEEELVINDDESEGIIFINLHPIFLFEFLKEINDNDYVNLISLKKNDDESSQQVEDWVEYFTYNLIS